MMFRVCMMTVLLVVGFSLPAFPFEYDCREWLSTCPPISDPCGCDSALINPLVIDSSTGENVTGDTVFTATGGRAPYSFEFDGGSLKDVAGQDNATAVDILTGCGAPSTAAVTDACGNANSMNALLPPGLSIDGPEDVNVGSQYAFIGGSPPISWSISCGTINETGMVTDLSNCCGSGTVTAADASGCRTSMEIRYPNGRWVVLHDESFSSDEGQCCGGTSQNITTITGSRKYYEVYTCGVYNLVFTDGHLQWNALQNKCTCCGSWATSKEEKQGADSIGTVHINSRTLGDERCEVVVVPSYDFHVRTCARIVYEWRCP